MLAVDTLQVSERIKSATAVHEPWTHYRVESVFAEAFYKEILSNLPKREEMVPLSRKTTNRHVLWLEPSRGCVLPPFWANLRATLFPALWEALENKIGMRGTSCGAELCNDEIGYYIGPHTDERLRLVTALFYLPSLPKRTRVSVASTVRERRAGTVLYRSDVPCTLGKGHAFSPEFQEVETIPYRANSMLFFPRTDFSFHAVKHTPYERWVLAFSVFR